MNHVYRHHIVNKRTFEYGRDIVKLWGDFCDVEDMPTDEFRKYREGPRILFRPLD